MTGRACGLSVDMRHATNTSQAYRTFRVIAISAIVIRATAIRVIGWSHYSVSMPHPVTTHVLQVAAHPDGY